MDNKPSYTVETITGKAKSNLERNVMPAIKLLTDDWLQSKIIYIDTLDGLESNSDYTFTIKEAFIDGMYGVYGFRSVVGAKVFILEIYFFV